MKGLAGLRVVSFESRFSKTLADLIRLQGGEPLEAPSMKEVPLENNTHVFDFYEKLKAGKIDVLILLTGVGTKTLVEALETRFPRETIFETLRRQTIVPRGPKPIRFLKEWSIPYALTVPEPNTWREILDTFDKNKKKVPLKGRQAAVQEYGVANPALVEGLEARGALVLSVPVYRWTLPDDLGPLRRAIQEILDGRVQVVLFTTAVQAENVLKVAQQLGAAERLKIALKNVVIGSVGPDTSSALKEKGILPDIEPESPKMGPLVMAAADKAKNILTNKNKTECAVELKSDVMDLVAAQDKLDESVFLKACRLEKTSTTPVWLMRQAGRYMKDYRDIREKTPFLDICKNKELVAEITVTAQQKIGADAAIIFSDILLIVECFGLGLEYLKGDGPSITRPVRTAQDIERLPEADTRSGLKFVSDAIRLTRRLLKADIPLIGFAGAPFTVASYMIEGGSAVNFEKTMALMKQNEKLWHRLLEKIASATIPYLRAQMDAGVQAIQLFDSWVGKLAAEDYERYCLPHSRRIFEALENRVPTIHFGTGANHLLKLMAQAGAAVIGVDHSTGLNDAWSVIGHDKAIQGNLDPKILLTDPDTIRKAAKKILAEVSGRPGHIFNLGHGVLPDTPVENVIALIQTVHDESIAVDS